MLAICLSYACHMLAICLSYACHMLVTCLQYASYSMCTQSGTAPTDRKAKKMNRAPNERLTWTIVLVICLSHACHMLVICLSYACHMLVICLAHAWHMTRAPVTEEHKTEAWKLGQGYSATVRSACVFAVFKTDQIYSPIGCSKMTSPRTSNLPEAVRFKIMSQMTL